MEPREKKRHRRKPSEVRNWSESEVKNLVTAYQSGKSRSEIASILGRTSGSVANKIRLLIETNILASRR